MITLILLSILLFSSGAAHTTTGTTAQIGAFTTTINVGTSASQAVGITSIETEDGTSAAPTLVGTSALAFETGTSFTMVSASGAVSASSDQPLAIVRRFRPTVNVRDAGTRQWVEARVAQQLFHSDTLRTAQEGYAVVQMVDNSLIRVRPNSMLIIRGDVNDRGGVNSRIDMEQGGISLQVIGRVSDFEVATQTSVAAVKGTRFSVVINPDGSTTITCFSGEVEVSARATGQTVSLRRGRRAMIDPQARAVQTERVSVREMRRLEAEEVRLEESSQPEVLRIRLRNADGEVREVEIPYFRNSN